MSSIKHCDRGVKSKESAANDRGVYYLGRCSCWACICSCWDRSCGPVSPPVVLVHWALSAMARSFLLSLQLLGTIEKKYQSPLNGFSPLKYQSPSLKVYFSLKVVVNRSTWVVYRSGTRGDPSRLGRTNQYSLFYKGYIICALPFVHGLRLTLPYVLLPSSTFRFRTFRIHTWFSLSRDFLPHSLLPS